MILTTHPENLVLETFTGKVLQAYWVDVDGNGTTKLPYGDDTIRIFVKTEDAIDKEIIVQVWYNRTGIDSMHKEFSKTITTDEVIYDFLCTPEFFGPNLDGNNIKEFYLYIKIGKGKFRYYSEKEDDRLRIHAVRFIPNVMQHLGWTNALNAQNTWFNAPAETTEDANVQTSFVSMDWILGYSKALIDYQNIINSEWDSPNYHQSLRDEVAKMITYIPISGNPIATLPTVEGVIGNKPFGDFSLNIVSDSNTGKTLPLVEQFYYKSFPYSFSVFDDLNDLFGTLGKFNFRLAAKGFLSIENETVYINVTKIGVYVRDSFDFTNSGFPDQDLGNWNFINKTVDKNLISSNYSIENSDYQRLRTHHNKGGDFRIYSDVKEVSIPEAGILKITLL